LAVIHRNVPPAQEDLSLFPYDVLKNPVAYLSLDRVLGKEHHPDPIVARWRQSKAKPGTLFSEELMGQLDKNSGPVSGPGVGTASSSVAQVDEYLKALLDDVVGLHTLYVGDNTHPTGIVLEPWVI
jgi:hypothetical protein